ncbi:MAG: 16S rRNA (cytosine(1402)-N(4))-methyltransferase RsmH [Myxococcota bacterium]
MMFLPLAPPLGHTTLGSADWGHVLDVVSIGDQLAWEVRPPMNFDHEPVLAEHVEALFAAEQPATLLDGTLGGAGHAAILLRALPELRLIGIDRDPNARAAATERLVPFAERAEVHEGTYSEFESVLGMLGVSAVDAMFLDLGVSSHQLDTAERGFSFRADAPLDMRMDPTQGQTAAELIEDADAEQLADILWRYGEERDSRRFARAIVKEKPTRTRELAELIERLTPASRGKTHPATRTFQALRIAVNDELGELERWLEAFPSRLNPGGVAAVLTFHSLEDRMVKQRFRELTQAPARSKYLPPDDSAIEFELPFRKALVGSEDEIASNPRARSAKLRAIRRKGRV